MEVKITNDGKGKWQSVEASIASTEVAFGGYIQIEIQGWGYTEEEARKQLQEQIDKAQVLLMNWITESSKLKV